MLELRAFIGAVEFEIAGVDDEVVRELRTIGCRGEAAAHLDARLTLKGKMKPRSRDRLRARSDPDPPRFRALIAIEKEYMPRGGRIAEMRQLGDQIGNRSLGRGIFLLRARLKWLPRWTSERRALAAEYRRRLKGSPVTVPAEHDPGHVYHLFPILSTERAALQAHLKARGVETLIHYPVPITRQPALASERPADCPVADRICAEVLSLPLHPGLTRQAVEEVAAALDAFHAPA